MHQLADVVRHTRNVTLDGMLHALGCHYEILRHHIGDAGEWVALGVQGPDQEPEGWGLATKQGLTASSALEVRQGSLTTLQRRTYRNGWRREAAVSARAHP
jgi:hypothetical protein